MKPSWRPVIGLEIHIELKTKSKMFCRCSADYLRVTTSKQGSSQGEGSYFAAKPMSKQGSSQGEGSYFAAKPNTHVCPVCLGLPGALPVANRKAIEWTVLTGLALNCKIPLLAKFDRKNYFYPDLPKGYQISQYDLPLARNGGLKLKTKNEKVKIVRVRRVHLEEDTAKLIHVRKKLQNKGATLIDFNRSGVPLMELVTEPDIGNSQEAKEFLRELQQIFRYLDISDCDMEKGSMRCEPNVSVRKLQRLPSYKVEIKNLNSFRFVERAIDYEIERQIKLFEQGKKPIQETRGWDEKRQVTYCQRGKEEASDYRYFPEPDLPPIRWATAKLKKLRAKIPELPDGKMARFVKQYGLSRDQARVLTATREGADYFEEAVKAGRKHAFSAKEIANVIINKRVNIKKLLPVELIQALAKKQARPGIKREDLSQIISEVLAENVGAVADYKGGKENAIESLVGRVMSKTKGAADPNEARKLLKKKIGSG